MAKRIRSTGARRAASAGSWLALLAAATLGDGAGTVHAEIRANGLRDGAYRLVVQSYDRAEGGLPGPSSRPVGSLQRAVTGAELREGIHVNLVELREGAGNRGPRPMVVAWIEAGEPDLEFDGLTARPQPGSIYGAAKRSAEGVQIRLDRVAG
jgi:hypothetical protein